LVDEEMTEEILDFGFWILDFNPKKVPILFF
jgi:hypothetical protein